MIKFLVFSDLHYDETPDGDKRIEDILVNARKRDLHFIVSLGDLCKPINANRKVLEKFNSLGVPFYNIIGNHETDDCKLNEILEFFSIGNPYYSVVFGEYKLIFLNTCYLQNKEKEEAYYNKNFKNNSSIYPIMPIEEIEWLRKELNHGMKYIIFSHHSFVNNFARRGVYNRGEIRKMFEEKPVLLCMNGHDHGDSYSSVNGISYLTVNSANYVWIGSQIASSKELQKRYSYLNGVLQYKQAMSAYVEIDDNEIRICGMEGEYLSVTPDDIGLHDYVWNGVSIKPHISSHLINF